MKIEGRLLLALCLVAGGCSESMSVDDIPVGSEVQVTRADGGVVEGTLAARDDKTVTVDVGRTTRQVVRQDVADVRVVDPAKEAVELPPIAKFREVLVPEGTALSVRLGDRVSSESSRVGDAVSATLADAVIVDGIEVLPAGSPVRGEVAVVQAAGKVKGRASLTLAFTTVTAHGDAYPLNTRFSMAAPAETKRDAAKIGIPAAGGAVIGAIIGGKKGAAIGAAAGGGAGTAAVLMTAGGPVELESGTELAMKTSRGFDVRIPVERVATTKEE